MTVNLNNRLILDDGTVLCKDSAIVDMLYADKSIESVVALPSDDIEMYNTSDGYLDTNYGRIEISDQAMYSETTWFNYWLTPDTYSTIDVESFIIDKCKTDVERYRAAEELIKYKERGLYPVLKHLIFLVDHWRSANIVWGVGRGSSVSSFVLYLIGINRINPLDFDLEIDEFLK